MAIDFRPILSVECLKQKNNGVGQAGLGRRSVIRRDLSAVFKSKNAEDALTHVHGERLALDAIVKTNYLYSMSSRLINVRLDADRLRKARTLRARGMALSEVVREAIDERFAALRRSECPPDVRAIVRRIFEQYPDPPGLPPRDYDVYNRRAARVAILRKLRTGRR